ncbi:protein kinase C delta type-like [Spea bombifrons]|uniref:protein kinase C delta type-like n=1 Tax=Spea bombifrons TaxID=233779 RepID=UPI00234A087F|nr:protein kinase C delta type-like [Spea bombifrons]
MPKKKKIKQEDDVLTMMMEGKCPHNSPMPLPPCFQLPNGHIVLKLKSGYAYSRKSKGMKRHISGRDEPDNKKKRKNTVSEKGTVPRKRKIQNTDKGEVANVKKKRTSAQKVYIEEACSTSQPTGKAASPRLGVEAPTSLESLVFHQELGRGGYGKVLLASDTLNKSKWAVKKVKKKHLRGSIQIEEQVLEMSAGCRFLVQGYSSFETERHLVYVMEYLCGGTLHDYLAVNSILDNNIANFFAAEITCGLKYLHCNGVVHRDLKPGNILLDAAGHVKIADFGLALLNMFGNKTATGRVGTKGYMAPEMIRGEHYDSAVDWWALGVILYEMATGGHPFDDGSDGHVVDTSVLYNTPYLPLWLSLEEKDILTQLLSKQPSSRLKLATNIRCHPFFQSIDWDELEDGRVAPPLQQSHKLRIIR